MQILQTKKMAVGLYFANSTGRPYIHARVTYSFKISQEGLVNSGIVYSRLPLKNSLKRGGTFYCDLQSGVVL